MPGKVDPTQAEMVAAVSLGYPGRMTLMRPGSTYARPVPVTTPQVFRSSDFVKRRLVQLKRGGQLVPVKAGWYLLERDLPDNKYERRRALMLARIHTHALTLPDGLLVSHRSAGLLLGFPSMQDPGCVEVSNFRDLQFSRTGVRVHKRPNEELESIYCNSTAVTTPRVTAVELLRILTPSSALAIADYALRIGCQLEDLQSINRSLSMPRGRAHADRVLALADAGAESPQESVLRHWTIAAGFPEVLTQRPVHTRIKTYFLDMAIEELKLAIEYDGEPKYADRQVLVAEKRREDAIREQGWEFVRVTKEDLRDVRALVARIQAAGVSRGWRRPART